MVSFGVEFKSLNEAIKNLSYARVYQSPLDKSNEFNIEVKEEDGGNYEAMKNLVKLAEKEGFIYKNYYEMHDLWGGYHYTAQMYHETNDVSCSFNQNAVYIKD